MLSGFKKIIYKIDQSESSTRLPPLLTFLFAVLVVFKNFYGQNLSSNYYIFYIFLIVSMFAVVMINLFILTAKAAASLRNKQIVLYMNKTSHILFDKITGFENISLRRETINRMLKKIKELNPDKLFEIGREIGFDFHKEYSKYLSKNEESSSYNELPEENKIKKWLDYDSESGMGKFELTKWQKNINDPINIVIRNSFTSYERKEELCDFLRGYISGYCEGVFNHNVEVSNCNCINCSERKCEFQITQV